MPPALQVHDRTRLLGILGLPADAQAPEVAAAGRRLVALLSARRNRLRAANVQEADALDGEIQCLEASLAALGPAPGLPDRRPRPVPALYGALLGVGVAVALLLFWNFGPQADWTSEEAPVGAIDTEPARLVLLGSLPGATLRVLDADRDRVFASVPAQDARVELEEGRYALEVGREDCPDEWTRSVYFDAGETFKFQPRICLGRGDLIVRSNVTQDRLLIDGLDVGATGPESHRLSTGDHEIRVEKQGYQSFEAKVRVEPDGKLELLAELEPLGSRASARRAAAKREPFANLAEQTLGSIAPPIPEPFDLGELRKEISPELDSGVDTGLLDRIGRRPLPDGGSTAWHDRVSRELRMRFDSDGSGTIDRLEEVESLSCTLWREIERDFDRGRLGLTLARYYGFDGSEWHPGALGFSRSQRSVAYARMQECGLRS